MATDRLLANVFSQAEQFDGSEFDSIDLSAPAQRKAGSMVWSELDDPSTAETIEDTPDGAGLQLADDTADVSEIEEAADLVLADAAEIDDEAESEVDTGADGTIDADDGDSTPVDTSVDIYDARFAQDDPNAMVLGTDDADNIVIGAGDFTYVKTHGGDDTVTLNVRGVLVYTGAGNDVVHGMASSDVNDPTEGIYLGYGDDTFAYFGGNTLVSGDDGDDTLILSGLNAADLLFVMSPGDVYHDPAAGYMLYIGSASDTAIALQVSGIEHILFGDGTTLHVPADLGDYVPDTYVYDAASQSLISSSEVVADIGPQLEDLYGTDESEFIQGGSLHDRIIAGSGDDTIHGGGGQDEIWGGDGNDLIYGTGLESFESGTIMSHGAFGGAGDDMLVHGGGFQGFDGGEGYDVLSLAGGPSDYIVRHYAGDGLYGEGFNYTIMFELNGIQIHVDLRNVETIAFESGLTFELQSGTGEQETYFSINSDGTTQAVEIVDSYGPAEAETVNELIFGTAADDVIDAGDGDDTVSAGKGNDTVFLGTGADYLDGGHGYDTLVLTGTWSDYRLEYAGSHSMWLQDARDSADAPTDGTDVLIDFEALQFANETLTLKALIARGGQVISGDGIIHGGFGDDTIYGADGSDSVMAGSGSNVVSTYDGSDYIIVQEARPGVSTRNVVDAGDGDDTIWLGDRQAGSEVTGGGGNDYLSAGTGTTFAIYRGAVSDYTVELVNTATGDDGRAINMYVVEDKVEGRDGVDTVEGALTLRFADATFNIADGTFDLLT